MLNDTFQPFAQLLQMLAAQGQPSQQPSQANVLAQLLAGTGNSDIPTNVLRYMQTAPSYGEGTGIAGRTGTGTAGTGTGWNYPYAGAEQDANAQRQTPSYDDLWGQSQFYRQNETNNYPRNEQDIVGRAALPRPRGMVQLPDGSWDYPPQPSNSQNPYMDFGMLNTLLFGGQ